MKIKILSSATEDLYDARLFYEGHGEGLGEYFFDSLFSDIDSLALSFILCGITLIADSDKTPASIAPLKTTLSSEAKAVSAGSSVWLTWTIQNTSNKTIYLLNHFAFLSRWPLLSLDFRDSMGKYSETLAFNYFFFYTFAENY
jgi:hypothetical protein